MFAQLISGQCVLSILLENKGNLYFSDVFMVYVEMEYCAELG